MSVPPQNAGESAARLLPDESMSSTLRRTVLAPIRFLSFWAAVLLPLVYLPLVHNGLTGGETTVLAVLLAANAVALVVGHDYAS
jgi:VIT1/CCC1 family predicted Fe2+/Mn2+ transporter